MKHQAHFEQLCHALCERLGQPDKLPEDRSGLRVLALQLQAVDAFLLHAPDTDPNTVCLVIALGSFAGNEQEGWQRLLEANHALRGSSAPRFARDPETNDALLQHAFTLEGVTPEDLHTRIQVMAGMAENWQRRQLGVMR
jgi:hypothetical protein